MEKGDAVDADKRPAFSLPVRPSAALSHPGVIKSVPPLWTPYVSADMDGRARTSALYSLERRKHNVMALDKKHIGFFEGLIFYLLLMFILAGSRKEGRLRRRGEPPPHHSVVHHKCCKQL